jgi:hypothetical protein
MFMPQSQLANAARGSDPAQLEVGRSGAAPAVLYLWWAAFAGANILQIGGNWTRPPSSGLGDPATVIDAYSRADQIAAIGSGLSVVAAVLGIATVLACTSRQRRLLATLGVHC